MKKITLLLVLVLSQFTFSQVGINTTTPDVSSMLDISATDKGVLVPRVSLNNVTTTMLDGINTAATGLLIWNTNASTTGGNGIGFYFFNGSQWMPIVQSGTSDHDFYEVGTTTPPTAITDNIVTQGNVTIGNTLSGGVAKLNVFSNSTNSTSLRIDNSGTIGLENQGIQITNNSLTGTSSERYIGVLTNLSSTNGFSQTGFKANFDNMSSGVIYYGLDNDFQAGGTNGNQRGLRNYFGGGENGFGVENSFPGAFTYSVATYGVNNNMSSEGNGAKYGTFNSISGSGTGAKYGTYTSIGSASGGTHYGIYSDVLKTGSYAGYFLGQLSIGTTTSNNYILPASRGTNGQVMQTNGTGAVSWVTPTPSTDDQNLTAPTLTGTTLNLGIESGTGTSIDLAPLQDGTGTDDQIIDNFSLSGTTLRLSLENDGLPLQTVSLSSLQDGTGTDDQNLTTPTLTGTTLNLGIESGTGTSIDLAPLQDGTGTDDQIIDNFSLSGTTLRLSLENDGLPLQTVNLATLDTQNTLDQAYDEGGAGAGRIITANNGAVEINANNPNSSGLIVTQTVGSGAKMYAGTFTATSGFPTAEPTAINAIATGKLGDVIAVDASIGNSISPLPPTAIINNYGIKSSVSDSNLTSSLTSNYGVYSSASGGDKNYGILSYTTGSASLIDNWAGYFGNPTALATEFSGNVYVKDFLEVDRGLIYKPNGLATTVGNILQYVDTNGLLDAVAPSTIFTDTDNQQIDVLSLTGDTLNISIQDDGVATQTLNLATIDNQATDVFSLTGTTLNLSLQNDGVATQTVNLASLVGTDDQNIQNLAFNTTSNILTVGIENGISQTVDLSILDTGGDVTAVTAGAGLTGGGITGAITINAAANNGLNVDATADAIQLGGPLLENTTIEQGIYSMDINLNSTGDFAIQDNGTDVFFVRDNGNIGMGTSNPIYPVHIFDNTTTNTSAVFIDKVDNTTAETSGVYVEKTSAGTGRNHAIFTDVNGTGTAQKYGVFNRITSTASGNQYGVRNFISGASPSNQFGTFNNIDNAGTANHYGVYNGMRGSAASNLYGTYNEFDNASTAANSYGNYTNFSSNSTGTGSKYGTYNNFDSAAGGTHYGTYNNVNITNGWAGYFVGKSYFSNKVGIGEANPSGFLEVRANNSGTEPNINLIHTGTLGSRINFTNTFTTNGNVWTLYGDTDNVDANSSFNIFHPNAGNIIQIKGDGKVGINRNPVTNDLEVSGTASKTTAGSWLANSDLRLKKNIETIEPIEALNKILDLRGVTYLWNDEKTGIKRPTESQMGFIAQEIQKVFPEKVSEDNLGYLQTAYGDYDPIVFQAIKALNDKIENLEKEIQELKKLINHK